MAEPRTQSRPGQGRQSPGRRVRPASRAGTRRRASRARLLLVGLVVVGALAALALAAGDKGGGGDVATTGAGAGGDGDFVHIHRLGVDAGDGSLLVATHNGLFRLPAGGEPRRVGARHDLMGFTVVSPARFLASGHPDRDDLSLAKPGVPPLLGLVESRDGGRTWKSLSLLGQADFHALVAAHGRVYGGDGTTGRFMVSEDGRDWETRSTTPLFGLAVSPDDADVIVGTGQRGTIRSEDGGRTWRSLDAPALTFLSWEAGSGLWGVGVDGTVFVSGDGSGGWERRGELGGRPAALLAADGTPYAATEEGAILSSRDGGRTWSARYDPE
ncbi:MAG: hypothetical protein M3P85_08615 [Actinomycetota bacterium]|nr:hypothetical protein [Actinomycetota bacterium]